MATAAAIAICYPMACSPSARADDSTVSKADLQKVLDDLDLQKKKLAAQEQALAEQQRVIANQQNQLNFLKGQIGLPDDPSVPVAYNLGNSVPSGPVSGVIPAQDQSKPVGEAPISSRPEIAIIPEQGGVLTHRGQLVIEPSIQYTHTSQDRFFFQGFEVVDTVLIGLIEATKADRNTVEAAIGARLGVTDRLELEARIPYVYRNDQISRQVLSTPGAGTIQSSASGSDIGDVEFAAHYDFTNLIFDQPYSVFTIANLKVKTPTGESPFDVPTDPVTGDPTRLATGTGFWSVQPSLTAIFPSDPVVFYGSFGYTINIGEDINHTFTGTPNCTNPSDPTSCPAASTTTIGFVDPGDSFNTSIGMGLSLNERASVSLGFSFDYVWETTQKVSGTDINGTLKSDPLYVGEFLVGGSYAISDSVAINLNFEVGATEAAPDFQAMLRVPIRFNVY